MIMESLKDEREIAYYNIEYTYKTSLSKTSSLIIYFLKHVQK